jgi:hypothetical protein
VKKHELLQALEPFTDETEVLVRMAGQYYYGVAEMVYGQRGDGEGVVVLTQGSRSTVPRLAKKSGERP